MGPDDNAPPTYRAAGVNIAAADEMLAEVKEAVRRTHSESVLHTLADFGGLYALGQYRDPVLVSGTDGVGTKLKIAFAMDRHDTIGQDLVAMCVDDIVCHGARPLFFLDYFATGGLHPATGATVIRGIAAACEQVGCALVGGETAEMPGFYVEGEYDLVGFAVGVVERDEMIDGSAVSVGDTIIGLASSGLHSNGYALARHVLLERAGLNLDEVPSGLSRPLGEELLEPTRLYAPHIVSLLSSGLRLHGLVHITGGGWPGNICRVIPEGLCAMVDPASIPAPAICELIADKGRILGAEMYRTFNMGVGMVVVVASQDAAACLSHFAACGIPAQVMGQVVVGDTRMAYVTEPVL